MHHVTIESIIMVLAKLKIHTRTFPWLKTLLALPSIMDSRIVQLCIQIKKYLKVISVTDFSISL